MKTATEWVDDPEFYERTEDMVESVRAEQLDAIRGGLLGAFCAYRDFDQSDKAEAIKDVLQSLARWTQVKL